ncbi:MAG: hypothetical protein L6Q71_05315 [Planctomycetes bacterium]|nr:hypothetical protein [Planctomycetota bacterium]
MTDAPPVLQRMIFNPIVLRELRVAGRSLRFFAALTISLLIQALVVAIAVFGHTSQGVYGNAAQVGRDAFTAETIAMLITVVIVFPAFSGMAIVSERDSRALDMLVLSHLATWEIVYGKLLAALAQASLIVVSAIPIFALTVTFGGIPLSVLLLVLGALFLLSVLISMAGIYSSVVFRRPIAALIVSYIAAQIFGFSAFMLSLAVYADLRLNEFGFVATLWRLELSERSFIMLLILVVAGLYLALFFLVSVARLKSAGENRASALRIYTIVTAATVILLFVGGYAVSDRVPAEYLPLGLVVIATLLIPLTVIPAIKGICETAFAPRVVAREFQRLPDQGGKRQLRWLLLPGSSSAFVLSVVLAGAVLLSFSATSTAAIHRVSESAPMKSLDEGCDNLEDWSSRDFRRRMRSDARQMAQGRSVAPIAPMGDLRLAYTEAANVVWRMAGFTLFLVVVFGTLAWSMSFTGINSRGASAIVTGIGMVLVVLPLLLANIRGGDLEGLRLLSPAQAGTLAALGIFGGLIGLRARKTAIKKRDAAAGRWPAPAIPVKAPRTDLA